MNRLLPLLILSVSFSFYGQIQTNDLPYYIEYELDDYSLENVTRSVRPLKSIAANLLEDKIDQQNGVAPRFGLKREIIIM
ncbi:hypothetical protein [Maribacter sp. ACAM166]|uniref:hypothetical protein n=1 Tax=Maribacter sp. ACAM166 TaxID=2508996 RepID=UPI0010FE64FE|nr:hypothetical protein [Maribacter sp. ACAM166]TLP79281.1 hypothetical protein ES765_10995 [Maribacter sp. ACAM166]